MSGSHNGDLPASILTSLDVAVFKHLGGGDFELSGDLPDWLADAWDDCAANSAVRPHERFVFLESFLEDALGVWSGGSTRDWISSGPWTEVAADGSELTLEAIAIAQNGHQALMLKHPTADYRTVQDILQKSRERDMAYADLVREINKREILLHCIIHDLSSPLAGIRGSLNVLEDDKLVAASGTRLLQISQNQAAKMQQLIADILTSFRAEVSQMVPSIVSLDEAPCLRIASESVASTLRPLGAQQNVHISVTEDSAPRDTARVAADAARLERVLFNLVDNALRYAPAGTSVELAVKDQDQTVTCTVIDSGPGVPEDEVDSLFERFHQGAGKAGVVGLGLYFCRITAADWGGSVSYSPAQSGGAAFTLELPKPTG